MMSEENQEVETVEVSAVEQLIGQITDGDLNSAEGSFQSLIQDKMADALEAQRIATAQAIFNDQDDDIEEIEDEEVELDDGEIEEVEEVEEVEEISEEEPEETEI
jgi:hypothetical protein|tara:strand:+ start:96 stop:410 length:315 start_codon:yes stop_codon:yes gene_type:complete